MISFQKKKEYNPFKNINIDLECKNINKYSIDCLFEKDDDKNMAKIFKYKDMYEWELLMYFTMMDRKFIPCVTPENLRIIYNTKEMVSLYTYLEKNKISIMDLKMILNELFGFVKNLMKYKFLHGNLHIHNIFIDPNTFKNNITFYIIDLSNSYKFKNLQNYPYVEDTNPLGIHNTWRSSFVGEKYIKSNTDINLLYWDLFTIYISLKIYLKNDISTLVYLEHIIKNYIKDTILDSLIQNFLETKTF